MPVFQSWPLGITGHASMPTARGRTASHTSTYGVPVTSTCGWRTAAARRASLLPATRWSSSTPSRWPGPGANARTSSSRWSAPSSRSTTIPSTRRSSPHTFSTSSASWTPSTQIRLPRATRAFAAHHRATARRGAPTVGHARPVVGRCAHRDEMGRGAVDRERARQVAVATLEPRVAAQDDLVAVERDQCAGEPGRAVQHPQSGCRLAVGILGGGAFGAVDRSRKDPAGRGQGCDGVTVEVVESGVRRRQHACPASTSPACA